MVKKITNSVIVLFVFLWILNLSTLISFAADDNTTFTISTGTYNNEIINGSKLTMKVTSSSAITGIVWSIDDTSIATIDQSGKVTPLKLGSVNVTAKIDGTNISQSCKVKIVNAIIYFSMEDDVTPDTSFTEKEIDAKMKVQLNAIVKSYADNKDINWSIQSGEGKIEHAETADVPNYSNTVRDSVYVSFSANSTQVVVRANLKNDPDTYLDVTFKLNGNSQALEAALLKLNELSVFTNEQQKKVNLLKDEANTLMSNENTTQAEYDALTSKILTYINELTGSINIDKSSQTTQPSHTNQTTQSKAINSMNNADTGDVSTVIVFWFVVISSSLLIICKHKNVRI